MNYYYTATTDNTPNEIDNKPKAYVEIVEQPAKCSLRFRYKCEGRSAGSLPGINSTADNKTFPSIRICNYVGRAVVVISCVTSEAPYRSHPHNIVGKEGCKKGICTIVINNEPDTVRTFSSLGIQCVKRKDIEESLSQRESINVDPYRNGFVHKFSASNIDLNVIRLCFQVFVEGSTPNKCDVPLTPIVSDPIHDKKAMSDLVITKLSHCSAPATGGREIILLCDRISKDDIQIRFYEERDGKLIWETYSDLAPTDIHKQVAICFKTPKYYDENIAQPVMVRIQLKRVSDNQVSEPRQFQFLPCESDEDIISRKRQKIEWVNMNHYALDNILQPTHQPLAHPSDYNGQANGQCNQRPQQAQRHQHQQPHLQPQPQHHHHHQQQQQAQRLTPEVCSPVCNLRPQVTATTPSPIPMLSPQQFHQHQHQQMTTTDTRPTNPSPEASTSPDNQHLQLQQQQHQRQRQQQQQQQQQQKQQERNMIDAQSMVVRREIIDNEGKVMRLVDRLNQSHNLQYLEQPNNKALGNSLDKIDTAELMRDITFNSNLELNFNSSLSMNGRS